MNKIVKRILIGTGILIVIIAICVFGFVMKMKTQMKGMRPIKTENIVGNIYTIKDSFVNFFLIKDSNQYIVIDAGMNLKAVKKGLKKLMIDPEKITAIFLTHTDRDHVAGISLFTNAKVYLAQKEVAMINGEKSKFLFMGNSINTKEYTTIEDQETITIGRTKIKGILTPGHTTGSMCYVINDSCLFTGDAISLESGKIAKPNEFFTMDNKLAKESISKIIALPKVTEIFTAHTSYSLDYQYAVKGWK